MEEEMIDIIMETLKEDAEKAVAHLKNEYQIIRAGRANPHILDKVVIDYYGVATPIIQMANVSVPEARMLVISVWDQSQIKNVSKAISIADLGVQPTDDGKIIRLVFPMLTEDRRKDLTKQVKKLCEDTKIAIRNLRKDSLDELKNLKKDGKISEDIYLSLEKDVQKLVEESNSKAESLSEQKEKEVMEV